MISIGIDVGGSKIAAAVVDVRGGILGRSLQIETPAADGGAAVLDACVGLGTDLSAGEAATVGIGLCELVDLSGIPVSGETIDWRPLDIEASFRTVGRVVVESDVRAAARAEATFGLGRGVDVFLFVVVGTGLSYCLVLHGRPYPGAHGAAILVGAPPVELQASGRALALQAGARRAEEMIDDPRHRELVATAAKSLGHALTWLVNALDPRLVVVGGGLGLHDRFREQAIDCFHEMSGTRPFGHPPVLPSELGPYGGVVGAALVGAEAVGSSAELGT
ncbi:MAG: ROK family protein [Thermoleophilia bacterium]|nr:ROK family protein [Thermoleophilia bacterium]